MHSTERQAATRHHNTANSPLKRSVNPHQKSASVTTRMRRSEDCLALESQEDADVVARLFRRYMVTSKYERLWWAAVLR